jgi:t-SNARE complex subunit (syntaxin)
LRELALAANDEVKIQNKMLDTLEEKVNNVHNHISNINVRLSETLEKARASDKICLDIFCVMILIGMIVVLVKLNSANS